MVNKWFVANDVGTVAGHDMSEASARELARELRNHKIWYICYYGSSGDGYVSIDNTPTNSFDFAMQFDDKEVAEKKFEELSKEWESELRLEFTHDVSWEALEG